MTKGFLNDKIVPISCPQCGHKNEKTIGWIKGNQYLTCAGCGAGTGLDTDQFRSEMRKVDKSIKNFQQEIERLNKLLKF